MTEQEAREDLAITTGNMITHLTLDPDGDYGFLSHIVCEYCHFCEIQGDCRRRPDAEPVLVTKEGKPLSGVPLYDDELDTP